MAYSSSGMYKWDAGFGGASSSSTYLYKTTDSNATVIASGYFPIAEAGHTFAINDVIYLNTADTPQLVYVASVNPTTVADLVDASVDIADGSITTAKLGDASVTLAKAAFPIVTYNSTYTTTGGGVTETISGAFLSSEKVHVTPTVLGATPVTLSTAKCNDGNITLTFSADPSTDHQFYITVTRG